MVEITLDQLRTFVTVVEEGNFSAAARKLRRVQSAVSTAMANLESQLGVTLWDRSTRVGRLTSEGEAVVARARRVMAEMDGLCAFTSSLASGVEPRVSLCVDALFPVRPLVEACSAFSQAFPAVDLRVDTRTWSAVTARVNDGDATLGVARRGGLDPGLEARPLTAAIKVIAVAAPAHPLASIEGWIPTNRFTEHVQIVLTECAAEGVSDERVRSPRMWRVADLSIKQEMIRRGLGWGTLPDHVASQDLARHRLVQLRPEAWSEHEQTLHFHAIRRVDQAFGPAHRSLLSALEKQCSEPIEHIRR